ncbi:MAG: DUF4440 domain-containing protein [Rhodospirillaceae bacterium]|nr:DUF4440 domain-containing protein [Rhodospirillaceae bacterium]HAA93874.1 DUF4440 domain-containing protein [Rhodospirillaceae bacterium]|tara:strand:+ start:145 stop:549 length:405 start_codon:yes stop_codon:yes gene_type:complete
MSERDAVLFCNDAFYAAFAGRDVDAMESLWAKVDDVSVIHPGWEPLFGRDAVIESWVGILSNENSPAIECRAARAVVRGESATVVCFEEIEGNFLVATNLFVKQDGAWRMTHHQAAPTSGRPSPEDQDQPPSIN